jgi:hypothetical protein
MHPPRYLADRANWRVRAMALNARSAPGLDGRSKKETPPVPQGIVHRARSASVKMLACSGKRAVGDEEVGLS